MLEGLSTPRGQIRPVGERGRVKPSLSSARTQPVGFQSVAIDHIPGKKKRAVSK